jgi:hypothetical protein
VQTIKVGGGIMGAPAYWNGHLYYFASNDVLKDFAVQGGRLSAEPVARGNRKNLDPGATPSVSANGAKDGIVWTLDTKGWQSDDRAAVLYAYDASNVAKELFDSEQNPARDRAGIARRFVSPVVANGRVYVAASQEVDVYGLLSPPKTEDRSRRSRGSKKRPQETPQQ